MQDMANKSGRSYSRTMAVRDAIEKDIVAGEFRPGQRLDEAFLARKFNVSRTPVRESLLQLCASGLIRHEPNRGMFVSQRDPITIVEMFEVMAELEGICAKFAARRASDEQLKAIKTAQEDCRKATPEGADAYYYANEIFHQAIYSASSNSYLAEKSSRLHKELRPYRRLQLRVPGRIDVSLREHDDVLAALTQHDGARAESALRAHVLIQGERFMDFFATISASSNPPRSPETVK